MTAKGFAMLALLGAALAGCVGGGSSAGPRPAPARASAAAAAPRSTIVLVPEVMSPQGLGGVIGSPAAALTRRFGTPRIDLAEGDAHKLQFTGKGCVLDIYLYPLSAGAQPTATHVEARLRQGGAPTDPGACIREAEKR
jgi:hypothetical protein